MNRIGILPSLRHARLAEHAPLMSNHQAKFPRTDPLTSADRGAGHGNRLARTLLTLTVSLLTYLIGFVGTVGLLFLLVS